MSYKQKSRNTANFPKIFGAPTAKLHIGSEKLGCKMGRTSMRTQR